MKKRTAPKHAPISLTVDQLVAVTGGKEPMQVTVTMTVESIKFSPANG